MKLKNTISFLILKWETKDALMLAACLTIATDSMLKTRLQ